MRKWWNVMCLSEDVQYWMFPRVVFEVWRQMADDHFGRWRGAPLWRRGNKEPFGSALWSTPQCSGDPGVTPWYQRSCPPTVSFGESAIHTHPNPPPPHNLPHCVSERRFPPTCLYPQLSIRGFQLHALKGTPSPPTPSFSSSSVELLLSGLLSALTLYQVVSICCFSVEPPIVRIPNPLFVSPQCYLAID